MKKTNLFQTNIFLPSRCQIGIILNNANHELIKNPYWESNGKIPNANVPKNPTAKTKFVMGPATEIIPFFL